MFIPISQNHSISNVTANVYLPQILIKPEIIFDEIIQQNLLSSYQKKQLDYSKIYNVSNEGIGVSNGDVKGFILEEFNQNGNSVNVLKFNNLDSKPKSHICFETKEYISWEEFKNRLLKDLKSLFEINKFISYLEAISLNFVDVFIWESQEKIPVLEIFDCNSELINSNFTQSYNGALSIVSQIEKKPGENSKEEKIELLFNNEFKRVFVDHIFIIKLSDFKEYDKNLLDHLFDEAHAKNKELLNKIFTKEIKQKINLQ